ncbi:unnamed protein product [Lupinus luteus]|uniref:Uncharacterized protein n=1 Tax=Lupinus luteus TaxID=3873 RepID=A0AAV1YJN6_LUPLU
MITLQLENDVFVKNFILQGSCFTRLMILRSVRSLEHGLRGLGIPTAIFTILHGSYHFNTIKPEMILRSVRSLEHGLRGFNFSLKTYVAASHLEKK